LVGLNFNSPPPSIDFNHDGKVDFQDIIYFVDAYINFNQHSILDPACDLNHDGIIDFSDVALFVDAYIAYAQSFATNSGKIILSEIPAVKSIYATK